MYIRQLTLVNFRNHAEANLAFQSGVNCIIGGNGMGKTNVLDAVHYLSMCRSYLNPIDKQNVRFNEGFFVIQGEWYRNEQPVQLYCGVKIGHKKTFKKNQKEYDRLADHIGQFPVVMISPYDTDLIREGSEIRRRWMDGIISQFDSGYLSVLQRYNKVVDQRNALLKQQFELGMFQREPLEIWDVQLVRYGEELFQKRLLFLEVFIPLFQQYYAFISEGKETVGMTYESHLKQGDFAEQLVHSFPRDARSTYTGTGVHKDDLIFTINDQPIRKFGSQGQQKSFLIALRLAQFDWLKTKLGQTPVLLLDDIFDKLDNQRVAKLMELVSNNTFGQVLVTDTDALRVQTIFDRISIHPNIIQFNDHE